MHPLQYNPGKDYIKSLINYLHLLFALKIVPIYMKKFSKLAKNKLHFARASIISNVPAEKYQEKQSGFLIEMNDHDKSGTLTKIAFF